MLVNSTGREKPDVMMGALASVLTDEFILVAAPSQSREIFALKWSLVFSTFNFLTSSDMSAATTFSRLQSGSSGGTGARWILSFSSINASEL